MQERRGERAFFEEWFTKNGYDVLKHDDLPFEGAADADFCGGFDMSRLYATHGIRTSMGAQKRVAEQLAKAKGANGENMGPIKTTLLRLVTEQ